MSNVTNTSQRLTPEAIGADTAQVLEILELGGGVSLTKYREIRFLGAN
jgi:hypothetical protein